MGFIIILVLWKLQYMFIIINIIIIIIIIIIIPREYTVSNWAHNFNDKTTQPIKYPNITPPTSK